MMRPSRSSTRNCPISASSSSRERFRSTPLSSSGAISSSDAADIVDLAQRDCSKGAATRVPLPSVVNSSVSSASRTLADDVAARHAGRQAWRRSPAALRCRASSTASRATSPATHWRSRALVLDAGGRAEGDQLVGAEHARGADGDVREVRLKASPVGE
jgi:hypothetical protein